MRVSSLTPGPTVDMGLAASLALGTPVQRRAYSFPALHRAPTGGYGVLQVGPHGGRMSVHVVAQALLQRRICYLHAIRRRASTDACHPLVGGPRLPHGPHGSDMVRQRDLLGAGHGCSQCSLPCLWPHANHRPAHRWPLLAGWVGPLVRVPHLAVTRCDGVGGFWMPNWGGVGVAPLSLGGHRAATSIVVRYLVGPRAMCPTWQG